MALKRADRVAMLAETIATNLFLSMLNPRYRGSNFRYSSFDIEGHVRNMIGMGLPSLPSAKELDIAGVKARARWSRMIAEVGDGLPKGAR